MSSIHDPIIIDNVAPITVKVTVGGKQYVLKEATEAAHCEYRNTVQKAIKWSEGKQVGVGDMENANSLLLSLCLFELYQPKKDSDTVAERPVILQQIRSWPRRVTRPLIERCKQISGIIKEETQEDDDKPSDEVADPKEAQSDTTTTSD